MRMHVTIALLVELGRQQCAVRGLQEAKAFEMGAYLSFEPSFITRQCYNQTSFHATSPKAPGKSRASSNAENANRRVADT